MRTLLSVVTLMICLAPEVYAADLFNRQYKAIMAEYFIGQHYHVPLFINGQVEKGDTILYPEESEVISRECFSLGRLRSLDVDSIEIVLEDGVSLGVIAELPAHRIAEIEAEIGAEFARVSSINISPASRIDSDHEPSESRLKDTEDCNVVKLLVHGSEARYIIATDVLRGKINVTSTISLNTGVLGSVRVAEKRLTELLGNDPRLSVTVEGNVGRIYASRSPSVRSIAVQSKFVDPHHLARLYELYQASGPRELERRVRKLLTLQEDDIFTKSLDDLVDFLEKNNLKEKNKSLFYNKMFFPEEVVDEKYLDKLPKEHWRAFGLIAAAHELAVW